MSDLELPADLRKEIADCVADKHVSEEWLIGLYRRGLSAKLGATGNFPYGPLRPDDEGELTVAMATDVRNGVIRLEFGKPVAWLALPASHAKALAALLFKKAGELERRLS